ncbi:MAG TPA: phosphatase PAP2 family protein [Caulobacteraceae bacterium]|nr:phosphatase PAP2 family protein [Caulobacteraceae bacterium]
MEQPVLAADARYAPAQARLSGFARALAAEAKADLPLLTIILIYAGAVAAACWLLGRPHFYHPLIYMGAFVPALVMALLSWFVFIEVPSAIISDWRRPMRSFLTRARRHSAARIIAGLALIAAAWVFLGAFTSAKSLANDLVPFHADRLLADVDAALHLGVDPWRLIQPLMGHHGVTRVIQKLYLSGWAMLLMGFIVAAALSARLAHVRTRFFLTYFASWIVLGNLMAVLFMSGGPVYFGELTGDHARFADQMGYLAFSDGMAKSSYTLQHTLWELYSSGRVYIGTGISAFPSLHVAMVTLFALAAFEVDRRLGWAMTAFAAVIFLGSVHLAWHYAIDGYVSAAFVAAVWFGLRRLELRRAA